MHPPHTDRPGPAGPRFRTTPKGTLLATFPLSVRGDDDKTTRHQIVAFVKRAEQVRASLKKGDAIELVAPDWIVG